MIARLPRLLVVAAAVLLVLAGCSRPAPLSQTEEVLWTTCTITLYDHPTRQTLDACFQRLREIHARMSVGVPGSELDAIAAAAGKTPVRVTDDVLSVTEKALQLAHLSDGLFDPTVGPLIKVWKINQDHPEVPKPADIASARRLVDWRDVVLDPTAKTIFLKRMGMQLDLGGLVKGYAADEAVRILSARGVRSAIVDLGGDVFAMGRSQTGQPWRIGVQNPDAERGTYLGIARVVNKTVVTSGVYEHYFIKDGKRYHHLMDTRTGYPVDNGLESVTVITQSSMDADGFGLALFCMGKADGLTLGSKLGLGVVMVDTNHKVFVTPGTKEYFAITDPGFTYAN
ncbi:MAG TPA: FAD:protein FMN transferase [Spirochaetia bacterium]|nr:FAD:protein FMN transferase [Spirochaetia bacterium]